ncbi:hypothetical protein [Winogradskyella bathintestinalis]|uniref:Selenophosphate synthetase n=1 Tax=Winogradskyella bathintestinalis TaxID=3035208 RepID=A0ABT7ZVZ5_9FLAO|nr:hypothetical protein [Winogradskyella bathintestinalis]MDN3492893.1 hypothetical protein [Winogradskyella bathintestinalis]
MKTLYISLFCILLATSCKSDKTENAISDKEQELSIGEKIANAHGFENWKNVSEVTFTFQVDRDTIKGNGRTWVWHPKLDKVKMTNKDTSIAYSRSKMDSTHVSVDQGFINDKFWLLVPFQLVWDTTATISDQTTAEAPISKTKLNLITLTYPNEGGYTPGDAYYIYFDDNYLIKEWVFRKGNTEKPSLTTTFENYKDYNGIKIATDHKMEGGNWNLNFTDITITLDE